MRVCNGGNVFSAMLEVPISDLSFRSAPECDPAENPGPAARILVVLHDFSYHEGNSKSLNFEDLRTVGRVGVVAGRG